MKIVLTGATGFLGAEVLAELLRFESIRVTACGRDRERLAALEDRFAHRAEKLSLQQSDLQDPSPVQGHVDVIVHAAAVRAPACTHPDTLVDTNVEGTRRLLEWGRDAGCARFVFVSTQAVYGTEGAPWSESSPVCPVTPYAISKRDAEELVLGTEGLESVVLRLARLYGVAPGVRWSELPGRVAQAVGRGEPLVVYGTGEQRFDLLHVRDAVRAVSSAALRPLPTDKIIYNVGGGRSHSINEFYQQVAELAQAYGLPPAVIRRDSAHPDGAHRHLELNVEKIRRELGWTPGFSLREGIEEYISYVAQKRLM
ncbi:NAD(P)-dependent oxidoreductase [Candidatus Bipolaricaulota bacterium]|nr:NAD(P)-dependent oxidoreductase [Candidatus Bipolaricaulota bacterium]